MFGPISLLLLLLMATPAFGSAQCICQQTDSGQCRRWYQQQVKWQLYAPNDGATGIKNAELIDAATRAFAAWTAVQCDTCMVAQDGACGPQKCPRNPLGVEFSYDGLAEAPLLASTCPKDGTGKTLPCDGSAAGTVQIAFLRSAVDWPVSQNVNSVTYVTTTHQGQIIDADILLRGSGDASFCTANCKSNQFDLHAVLMREVGHLLGMGDRDETQAVLAADFKPGLQPLFSIASTDNNCACELYRTSALLSACTTPTTEELAVEGCAAQPRTSGARADNPLYFWLLVLIAPLVAVLLRYRNGRNSPTP